MQSKFNNQNLQIFAQSYPGRWIKFCVYFHPILSGIHANIKKIELNKNTTQMFMYSTIGDVKNIPTMQFYTKISLNTQSKSYMLSLTGCVWDFQNTALWDTH